MGLGRSLRFCALALSLLAACAAGAGSIRFEGAWARPGGFGPGAMGMPAISTSAVYFTVVGSGSADTIVGAMVDPAIAEAAEVHETKVVNGVAQMAPAARVDLPASGRVEFKPGGYHVMLVNLKRELKAGDRVTGSLVFEKAGAVPFEAEVRAQ